MDQSSSWKETFLARGFAAIDEMVRAEQEETLHLEFKTLANAASVNLTKDDRRLIAKSICGFANAEGGILLLGVETKRSDGVDVAAARKDFVNVEALRNRVASAVSEMLSPDHGAISVHALISPATPTAGSIMISVPSSENRPHMSTAHHQYFRRVSDGTRVLEHGEVRDLMFAPREANLSLQYRMRHKMSTGDKIFAFDFVLSLRNEGKVAVRAPFVRAEGGALTLISDHDQLFTRRRLPSGAWGVYANRDVLVHVGDEVEIAAIKTGLHLHEADAYESKYFIRRVVLEGKRPLFSIRTYDESRSNPRPYDKLIDVMISFGGENAALQVEPIKLDNWATVKMMADILAPL